MMPDSAAPARSRYFVLCKVKVVLPLRNGIARRTTQFATPVLTTTGCPYPAGSLSGSHCAAYTHSCLGGCQERKFRCFEGKQRVSEYCWRNEPASRSALAHDSARQPWQSCTRGKCFPTALPQSYSVYQPSESFSRSSGADMIREARDIRPRLMGVLLTTRSSGRILLESRCDQGWLFKFSFIPQSIVQFSSWIPAI